MNLLIWSTQYLFEILKLCVATRLSGLGYSNLIEKFISLFQTDRKTGRSSQRGQIRLFYY